MTDRLDTPHLTQDEVQLWAEGLLPAARALHLADCRPCLEVAERERSFVIELSRLPQLAPREGFADRVMARVRLPTPSGQVRS